MRLASHVLCMKNVVFKGQVFVVWIDLPAIETCILVEIDLQVYIFGHKVGFTGPKVYFFIFCRLLDGARKSRGDANFACFSWQHNLFAFFLSNAGVSMFFNGTVVCCKKPSYFFLFFIFWQSFKYFPYFFHSCICV